MGAIIEIGTVCGFVSYLLFFQTEVICIYFLFLELFQWEECLHKQKILSS